MYSAKTIHGIAIAIIFGLFSVSSETAFGQQVPFSKYVQYEAPDGATYFALGFGIEQLPKSVEPTEVVVFFDTSASQTGVYREKSLGVLESFLQTLDDRDQVMICSIDIDPRVHTKKFLPARSPEATKAIEDIKKIAPLGATDVGSMLKTALKIFAERENTQRSLVYIGDGMSSANLLEYKTIKKLTGQMVQLRVPFHAVAIGSRKDIELLGCLANHTGGNIGVDVSDFPARKFATYMANSVHGTIIWPEKVIFPREVEAYYPIQIPPLRSDRDSVLIGKGKLSADFTFKYRGSINAKPTNFTWDVAPEMPTDGHSFLAELVKKSELHEGVNLATAGSDSLTLYKQVAAGQVQSLLRLARQALEARNLDQAESIVNRILEQDPQDAEAKVMKSSITRLRAQGVKGGNQQIEDKAKEGKPGEKVNPAPGKDIKIKSE